MLDSDATRVIASHRGNAVAVCTMTTIRTFALAIPNDLNIRCAPLMGGASSIGLGIAIARPDRKVIVLDGDGSLLMQLGALATIANAAPRNLIHFVFDNGILYEGGGNIPVVGSGRVDFVTIAKAAGYGATYDFSDSGVLDADFHRIWNGPGPALVRLAIDLPDVPVWSNDNPHPVQPDWWFEMLREDGARVRALLSGDAGAPE